MRFKKLGYNIEIDVKQMETLQKEIYALVTKAYPDEPYKAGILLRVYPNLNALYEIHDAYEETND